MTIATTNYNRRLSYVMRWLLVGIVGLCVVSIGLYNSTVALRRTVTQKAKAVEALKLEGAELKNTFYTSLDNKALVATAERLGYVRDSSPLHLTLRADGTAMQDNGSPVSLNNNP